MNNLSHMKLQLAFVVFWTCLVAAASVPALAIQPKALKVSVSKAKAERGDRVEIVVTGGDRTLGVVLLKPNVGPQVLELRPGGDAMRAVFAIPANAATGLYAVHAWTGDRAKPTAVGKASFRVGNIVADFFIANYVDKIRPAEDIDAYIKDFRAVGGNFLIAHNLIIPSGAFYRSRIAKTDPAQADIVEMVLERADRLGSPVLISVSWDMTRTSPFKQRMSEIRSIATELYTLYRHHPSLAGFYSYQEGSGTYYAPFVREFSEHIKAMDRGLLTACAPHIDDPLLASYLSVIEELDVMIYQSAVMASYRPDNRKEYPLRRVHDFSGLGSGAKRLQNKIVLTHVELFAYMEKRLRPEVLTAPHNDIYGQILSAATVTDTDGISLFAYHSHIFDQSKRFDAGKTGRSAVENGLRAYQAITETISNERNPIAMYVPYSDFVIERWNNYFLPALDAFRRLGISIDILPYAPPLAESIYPYYPYHMNEDVLERLLAENTVLVLANVSGFQQTDSDLIKAFVERGGVVVAFGPQIPFGRTYERKDLFGGEQLIIGSHSRILTGTTSVRFPGSKLPAWRPTTASVGAKYEDGSAAILTNKFGNGAAITILPDAGFSAKFMPGTIRKVLNTALEFSGKPSIAEIDGMDENMDLAVRQTRSGFTAAVVNHNTTQRRIRMRAPMSNLRCTARNEQSHRLVMQFQPKANTFLFQIPKNNFVIVECK